MSEVHFSENIKIPADTLFSIKDCMDIYDGLEDLLYIFDHNPNMLDALSSEQLDEHSEYVNRLSSLKDRIGSFLSEHGFSPNPDDV